MFSDLKRTNRPCQMATQRSYQRRGAAVWVVAVSLTVTLGFAAIVIDLGTSYIARSQLQSAADAAALAGASAYITDAALMDQTDIVTALIQTRAQGTSSLNFTLSDPTQLAVTDIQWGTYWTDGRSDRFDFGATGPLNLAQVVVHRREGSINGPVPYLFAKIFGKSAGNVSAVAAAWLDDRFAGLNFSESEGVMTPFTVNEVLYADMVANGADEFSFNDISGVDTGAADGVREVKLFPWKEKNQEGSDGAGNFGLLNIGITNQGTSEVEDQIINGVTADQLDREIGTSVLEFVDDWGDPLTHNMTGNPGMSAGLKDAVQHRVGDIIGFFTHRTVDLSGANASFTITSVRFGRLMHIDLTGSPKNKAIVVQPIVYTGGGVITKPSAPSTSGMVGNLTLVK